MQPVREKSTSNPSVDACVEALYEAAAAPWPDQNTAWAWAGEVLRRLLSAESASLFVRGEERPQGFVWAPHLPDAAVAAYAQHYHAADPWVAEALAASGRPFGSATLGDELIGDEAYRETEWYADFARHLGLFHMLGALVPLEGGCVAPLGLHRPADARPFTRREAQDLDAVLPHLRRALLLRSRLVERLPNGLAAGLAALDLLPEGAIVAHPDGAVTLANKAARTMAGSGGPIRLLRAPTGLVHVSAADRSAADGLARILASPHGGAMLLRGAAGDLVAASSLPLPGQFAAGGRRSVLLRLLPLTRIEPDAPLLTALFGFTPAEATVVAHLLSGLTLAQAARMRGVAFETARSQARAACEKAGVSGIKQLVVLLGATRSLMPSRP